MPEIDNDHSTFNKLSNINSASYRSSRTFCKNILEDRLSLYSISLIGARKFFMESADMKRGDKGGLPKEGNVMGSSC